MEGKELGCFKNGEMGYKEDWIVIKGYSNVEIVNLN